MTSSAATPNEYIKELPIERKAVVQKLRETVLENIPKGFEETMGYGMLAYVVPKSTYPAGYHCSPELPLPFVNIASQKNFIALYHSGMYADKNLYDWFVAEYPKHCKYKLDMGKSCVRFKKMDDIPYDLVAQLMQKMTVDDWIKLYETTYRS